jgi:aminoglycoside phosphotransferase (APT) family kinase protein
VNDPLLQEQVQLILHASGRAPRTGQLVQIEAITNSFQDKGNVFKIDINDGPSFVLKLEHSFFESRLDHEAHLLALLSSVDVPVPRLIHHGMCTVYQIDTLFPRYMLMERLSGIPLNWVYYRADVEERRVYLRQVIELVGTLSTLNMLQPPTLPTLGSPVGRIIHDGRDLSCEELAPFPQESIGPFRTIDDMFQAQIGFWLTQLCTQQPHAHTAEQLESVWHRLDRTVLAHDVPVVLAHADISPMNIIVDPDARRINGLIDWEFGGSYPADMDFHSLLYYDRYQGWKWTGPTDVQLAQELMQELQIRPPDGYAGRLV